LYVLYEYPQISQTYIECEMEAIESDCEIRVIARKSPNLACACHHPYSLLDDPTKISEVIDEFRPHVLHSHYLTMVPFMTDLARRKNIPFTIRTHSFDAMWDGKHRSPAARIRHMFRR